MKQILILLILLSVFPVKKILILLYRISILQKSNLYKFYIRR